MADPLPLELPKVEDVEDNIELNTSNLVNEIDQEEERVEMEVEVELDGKDISEKEGKVEKVGTSEINQDIEEEKTAEDEKIKEKELGEAENTVEKEEESENIKELEIKENTIEEATGVNVEANDQKSAESDVKGASVKPDLRVNTEEDGDMVWKQIEKETFSPSNVVRPRGRSDLKLRAKENMSLSRKAFQKNQQEFVATELAEWVSKMTNISVNAKTLCKKLESGDVLCDLLTACKGPKIKGVVRRSRRSSDVMKSPRAKKWQSRDNLKKFRDAARDYGINDLDLISPLDLEENNLKNVNNCLLAIARMSTLYGQILSPALSAVVGQIGLSIGGLHGKMVILASIMRMFVSASDHDISLSKVQDENELFMVVVDKSNDSVRFQSKVTGQYLCVEEGEDGKEILSLTSDISKCQPFFIVKPPRKLAASYPHYVMVKSKERKHWACEEDSESVILRKMTNKENLFILRIVADGSEKIVLPFEKMEAKKEEVIMEEPKESEPLLASNKGPLIPDSHFKLHVDEACCCGCCSSCCVKYFLCCLCCECCFKKHRRLISEGDEM
mmetsp:Transcript_21444/g.31883  ORF Transcript_21444/g.31883 Transcript_21444/m.31883 type:complete len:559 (-) Transcript_21444:73-1749(-)